MLFASRLRSSSVISAALSQLENDIQNKTRMANMIDRLREMQIDFMQADPNSLVELSFMCGRIAKIGLNARQKEVVHRTVETVSFSLDLSSMAASETARFFWACATVGVNPLVPDTLSNHLGGQRISTRDLCTLIWGLSKWASSRDQVKLDLFNALVNRVNDGHNFSDADIASISRAIALVNCR